MDQEKESYPNGKNSFGVPLTNQTGRDAIRHFDAIIAALSPVLRAAFEAERIAQRAEIDRYMCQPLLSK
jgi:hypothetical protein